MGSSRLLELGMKKWIIFFFLRDFIDGNKI
jgi:hypothetical protein